MKYLLYNHGGSQNHGCEALVRTVLQMLENEQVGLYTESVFQDEYYGLDQLVKLVPAKGSYSKLSPEFIKAYILLKIKGAYTMMDTLPYRNPINAMPNDAAVISIGGDIYCYDDFQKFIALHGLIAKSHKTALLGCSINESLIRNQDFCKDIKKYDYVSTRESLSYELLKSVGVENVEYHPDPAFLLPLDELPLPNGFIEGKTVGINLSPLIARKEKKSGILREAMMDLIQFVLKETDYSIALIPHVIWKDNDDRTVLMQLYDEANCPERIVMIEDCNCMQLKGYISRCRFFIGARTHATIAAYSTGVPTLGLGYSLKSRGIATDLFGTDLNYVLPIENVLSGKHVVEACRWLFDHEVFVKEQLLSLMPDYKLLASKAIESLKTRIEE